MGYRAVPRTRSARSAQARHARYGDSPYLVEPHLKEGRGGLRDLQTLYWLARYAFDVADACRSSSVPTAPAAGF